MIMQGLKSMDIKEVITFKVLEFVILAISDTGTLSPSQFTVTDLKCGYQLMKYKHPWTSNELQWLKRDDRVPGK